MKVQKIGDTHLIPTEEIDVYISVGESNQHDKILQSNFVIEMFSRVDLLLAVIANDIHDIHCPVSVSLSE